MGEKLIGWTIVIFVPAIILQLLEIDWIFGDSIVRRIWNFRIVGIRYANSAALILLIQMY